MKGNSNTSKFTGAGFAIIDLDNVKLLALVKKNGRFDIPKGHKDKGETPFQTACRECWEECSLSITGKDLLTNKVYISDGLHVFAAKSSVTPKIKRNPVTNELEHLTHIWLTPDEFSKNSPKYLSRIIYAIFNDII